ncbi:hypothetical protein G4B88_008956 [Cannabis sativa]|uniref:RING-type E3 ubiquitin transferase n=1 Tax=Cannabis sativa TaxID=3483 RepID=A0A7J6HS29_CANSA|nr:hypothetical protein G4B88_008956 [Cannabis sativa]
MTRFSVSGDEEEENGGKRVAFPSSSSRLKRHRSVQSECSYSSSEDEHPFGYDLPFEPLREPQIEDINVARGEEEREDINVTGGEEEIEEEEEQEEEEEEVEEEEEEQEEEQEQEREQEESNVSEHDFSLLGRSPFSLLGRSPTPTDGSVSTTRDKSIPVVLTDPDVLDCSICFEPLTIPVFQCENGHTACSTCCTKINNKCPSCSFPIGYNRCRAIEKVLESVKIRCSNASYGCKETVSYNKKKEHETSCTYSPCHCPIRSCDFISSSTELYRHFRSQHSISTGVRSFDYNSTFSVTLLNCVDFVVLQERKDNVIFILNSTFKTFGYMVWISCIWPCPFKGFWYEILAKTDETTLRLESFTSCNQQRVVTTGPSSGYLLIPMNLFGCRGQLELAICIHSLPVAAV